MRSRRVDRKELKSEIASLRAQLALVREKPAAEQIAAAAPAPEAPDAPKIAACGYPMRSEPQRPKSLKEAKELLMSLRDW